MGTFPATEAIPPASMTPTRYLFGGDRAWNSQAWTASDDRVRGGRSQSYLETNFPPCARFFGTLDTTALGGAGFASQRTTNSLDLDLSGYDGIVLAIGGVDEKRYTLTLKDEIPRKRDDGRDQSTISWEYDFTTSPGCDVVIRWSDLKPTYRGKQKPDAKPLDLTSIKRMSFMMRSFFGKQAGPFSLEVRFVAAFVTRPPSSSSEATIKDLDGRQNQKQQQEHQCQQQHYRGHRSSWITFFCGLFR